MIRVRWGGSWYQSGRWKYWAAWKWGLPWKPTMLVNAVQKHRVQAKDVDGSDSTWRALPGWQDVSKLSPKPGWATLNFCFNQWPHISSLESARTQRWGHSCLRKFMCLLGQSGGHVIAMLHNNYFYRVGWNVAWRSKEEAGPILRRCSLSYSLEKSMFSKWMAVECYLSGQSKLLLQEAESELGRCDAGVVLEGTCDGGRRAQHESN